jgi:hypothetical protein
MGWLDMAHNSWILNLIDDNVIGVNGKHIIAIIWVCYKIASNFAPNKEGLFLFFHLFPTCSIQIPNGFPLVMPFFYEGITQDGDRKGFGCH